ALLVLEVDADTKSTRDRGQHKSEDRFLPRLQYQHLDCRVPNENLKPSRIPGQETWGSSLLAVPGLSHAAFQPVTPMRTRLTGCKLVQRRLRQGGRRQEEDGEVLCKDTQWCFY